jgi:hypothetical protein
VSGVGGDAFAEPQHLDAVTHLEHVRHGVADEYDRNALVAHAFYGFEDILGLHDAERRGRLVEDEHLVRPRHRPGDGNTLALSARHRPDRRGQ